jgi:hypothetical protein
MCVVDETVEDGVGQGRLADDVMMPLSLTGSSMRWR